MKKKRTTILLRKFILCFCSFYLWYQTISGYGKDNFPQENFNFQNKMKIKMNGKFGFFPTEHSFFDYFCTVS